MFNLKPCVIFSDFDESWTALPLNQVPEVLLSGDAERIEDFWETWTKPFGSGDTPQDAYESMRLQYKHCFNEFGELVEEGE